MSTLSVQALSNRDNTLKVRATQSPVSDVVLNLFYKLDTFLGFHWLLFLKHRDSIMWYLIDILKAIVEIHNT